jgi:hypothetical protein
MAEPSSLLDTRVVDCGDNLEQLKKLPDACVDLIYIDHSGVGVIESRISGKDDQVYSGDDSKALKAQHKISLCQKRLS